MQLIIILVLLIPILAIVLDSPVGRALAGRMERRGLGAGEDMTAERLAFLEGEIERLNDDIRRLEDESQFMQNLLVERTESESGSESKAEALPPSGDEQG